MSDSNVNIVGSSPPEADELLLDVLVEVATCLSSPRPIQENLESALYAIVSAVGLDRGVLYAPQPPDELALVAQAGPAVEANPAPQTLFPGATSVQAFEERSMLIENNHVPGARSKRTINSLGLHSIAAFPVEYMERCLGVLHFGSTQPGFFDDTRVKFLAAATESCAALIYNAELHDETERQLQRASDRSEFIAIASHELRTPIAVISGFSELLIDSGEASGTDLDWLTHIHEQATRLTNIVDDLVNLEWMRNGDEMGRHTVFSVQACCERVRSMVLADWPEKLLHVGIDRDAKIIGDRDRLERVVAGVADNAFRHAGVDEAWIDVSLNEEADSCTFSVRDLGSGFPDDFSAEDVKLFKRPTRARTTESSGLSLGLFVVKTFHESVGGTLDITTDEHGTAVRMSFPAVIVA